MAKYVMSDLHGCYDKFRAMLDKINFTNEDELYILGDIFDRGDKALEILDYVVGHRNIYLLKGNHEKMFEEYCESGDAHLWYSNGGQTTHMQLLQKNHFEYENIYRYIRKLPLVKVVDKYILVHAGLSFLKGYEDMTIEEFISSQDEDTCLWDRSNIGDEKRFKDYTIICGHTPVQTITENYENPKILKENGTIYIDCGCVFKHINGALSCLRLDDLAEFYIE